MSEHVAYQSTAHAADLAVQRAKETAKAAGRRVRTLVGVKGEPGDWTVTLALDEIAPETVHEFAPMPLYPQDKPDHVCNGGCACALCSRQKGDRDIHYQTRDRRRPKATAS